MSHCLHNSFLVCFQSGPPLLWAQDTASSSSPVACWSLPTPTTSTAKSALDSCARRPRTPSASTAMTTAGPGALGRRCRGRRAWSVRWCRSTRRTAPTFCMSTPAAPWDTESRPSALMTERRFRRASWCSGWRSLTTVAMVAWWGSLRRCVHSTVGRNAAADTGCLLPASPTAAMWPLLAPLPILHFVKVLRPTSSPLPGSYTPIQHGQPHVKTWECPSAFSLVIQTAGVAPGWSTRAPAGTQTWPI